jgi:hypothetical protein
MIGQKDNKLNIDTAAASQRIAEIGLLHNTAMKGMAEDSRNIAVLTRKDSTDMRSIAVVTLLFLPGTFMATLFSAGFFNFIPSNSPQVVSKWIWLYFLLTSVTTIFIFLGWHLFSTRQSKEIMTGINLETLRPLPRNRVFEDRENGVIATPPALEASPLWTARSRSIGEIEPYSSFGSSPDAPRETIK